MIQRFRLKFISEVILVVAVIIITLGLAVNTAVYAGTISKYDESIDAFYDEITHIQNVFTEPDLSPYLINDSRMFVVRYLKDSGFNTFDLHNIINVDADTASDTAENALLSATDYGTVDQYRFGAFSDETGNILFIFVSLKANNDFIDELQTTTIIVSIAVFLITAFIAIPISNNIVFTVSEHINAQKEFITNASHDLKTPVAVISANMDVLSLKDKDNQWIESTKKQVKYLKKLINNIIVTSKLMEKGFSAPFEDFDLSNATQSIVEIFTEIAHSKNLTYTVNIEPDITCYGNDFYYRQLITILCENALKYSVENGKIDIALRKYKDNIYFNITKTRDPKASIEVHKLFDRFYRGDKSRSTDTYGNGLGLSMAKSIAEMHKGSISAYCKTHDTITFSVILKG